MSNRRHLLLLASAIAVIMFVTDLIVELGVAIGILYVAVVWLAYAAGRMRDVWVAAAVCSLLTLIGLVFSPPGGEIWKVLANRGLSLTAIWVTVYLCRRELKMLAEQTERAKAAEQLAADIVRRRDEERRQRRAMITIMEDLRFERERVKASEHRTRSTIDSALDAVVTIDQQGIVINWNPQAERTFGWSCAEAVGQPLVELIVPPQHRQAHQQGMERFNATGEGPVLNQRLELTALRRTGEEFPIELSIASLLLHGRYEFSAFIRDLTERKQAERARAGYAAELKRSNQELEQFAYVASHDLKEPLRMVASYTGLLAEEYEGRLDAEADKYIRYATEGAKRMQCLIDDLLVYSRVGRGDAPFRDVDMNEVARNVLENLSVAIATAQATVNVEKLPIVEGNPTRLTQLLQNLIGNALKFRGEHPPLVQVRCRRDGAHWELSVEDNGIGIAPEYQERIFQVFQRLHSRQEYPGTGIGLAVCKKIVEHHQGRIWVESTAGDGAVFRFTLPARPASLAAQPTPTKESQQQWPT